MGRAFEFRKARKFKRWGNMSRTFTKIGKEIAIAVKSGGGDPHSNAHLRVLIQNAKAANMPKENVERAIKRAISKDTENYKEMVYEGYGPFGVAMVIETATDNTTRTVANVRSYFNKASGSLGTSGCLDFIFDRKSVFRITPTQGLDIEELELELIDFGAEELFADQDEIVVYGSFDSYGKLQAYFDEHGIEIVSGEFERLPTDTKVVTDEQRESIEKLIEKFEEDEDVTNVFHNMAPLEDEEQDEQA
ncbi:MAG: YebC/PmpR family DNA-binding transcriptional regulator [Mucinivorans sp.]